MDGMNAFRDDVAEADIWLGRAAAIPRVSEAVTVTLPIDEETAKRLIEALDDGRLDYLFQTSHIDYAERDGFAGTSSVLGLPREAVTHLLASIRRAQGLPILTGAWGDYSAWVTLSAEMVELLHEIDIRSTFAFTQTDELPEDEIRYLKRKILIEEVLQLGLTRGEYTPTDPIELARMVPRARRMLDEGTEPTTEYGRWVRRFFELMERLPELATEPLTYNRLLELHSRIVLDKSLGGVLRDTEIEHPEFGLSADGQGTPPERISAELHAIAAYGTTVQKPYVHPMIKTVVYFYWIRRIQPFKIANGLFTRLIIHIFEYQQGYKCLPFTPLTRNMSAEWGVPPPDAGEAQFDATTFVIKRLRMFLNAYIEGERELERAVQRYRTLLVRYQALEINHRQARILDKALSVPTTVFTIRRHAISRGLAYETARQDFLQLVNAGYLDQTKRGRVFEFRLAQGAEKKLMPRLLI